MLGPGLQRFGLSLPSGLGREVSCPGHAGLHGLGPAKAKPKHGPCESLNPAPRTRVQQGSAGPETKPHDPLS